MKLTPAEKQYARTMAALYPHANLRDILSSPQFLNFSGMARARAWTRRGSDGTLARVFPPPKVEIHALMTVRLCAQCGLNFFATVSFFCGECSTL